MSVCVCVCVSVSVCVCVCQKHLIVNRCPVSQWDTFVECTTNKTFPLQSWYSNVVISNTVHDNGSSDYCNVY